MGGEVEFHRPILDIGDRAKMSAIFLLTPSFNATLTVSSQPTPEDLTIFFSQHGVARVEISSRVYFISQDNSRQPIFRPNDMVKAYEPQ